MANPVYDVAAGANRGLLNFADALVGNPIAGLANALGAVHTPYDPITRYFQELGLAADTGTTANQLGYLPGRMAGSMLPVAGDLADLNADVTAFRQGKVEPTAGNVGLSALGLLPFVPGMTVYHASPKALPENFAPEFSPRTSLTGEGTLDEGPGFYTAENPGVGQAYFQQFAGPIYNPVNEGLGDGFTPLKTLSRNPNATLTKLELPDEMLPFFANLEVPYMRQPEWIQEAVLKANEGPLPGNLYEPMLNTFSKLPKTPGIAERLHGQGLLGTWHPDAGSTPEGIAQILRGKTLGDVDEWKWPVELPELYRELKEFNKAQAGSAGEYFPKGLTQELDRYLRRPGELDQAAKDVYGWLGLQYPGRTGNYVIHQPQSIPGLQLEGLVRAGENQNFLFADPSTWQWPGSSR